MAAGTLNSSPILLLFTLTLITSPSPSHSVAVPITAFHSISSLALASVFSRVANLRAARGDISGSDRARSIARKIEQQQGLNFYGFVWSAGQDYLKNYAWRDARTASFEMAGAVSDVKELVVSLSELARLESHAERVAWVQRNNDVVLKVSKSLLNRLLKVFSQPGPLKEAIEMVQREVVDGALIRDFLELGSGVKCFIILASSYFSAGPPLQYRHRSRF